MTRTWQSPLGDLVLSRWPVKDNDPLQAWDGADRYLLETLAERGIDDGRVLVVDDAFGALGTALGQRAHVWADSELSRLGLAANSVRNGSTVGWTPMTEVPPGDVSAVIGRLPRSTRRLAWIARRLAEVIRPGTPVIFGAKSKQVQKSAVATIDAALGPAQSTRAQHRARLVEATRDDRVAAPMPVKEWSLAGALRILAFPGVFGEEALDGGTALLLPTIPSGVTGTIVDLGCGAGPLGLMSARRSPHATIVFRDASHLAVASAERAWMQLGMTNPARFEPADVLEGMGDRSVDLVLCNPPFHQGTTVSRRVAAHMFRESRRVLRDGGRLLVVGNRHLGYHAALKGLFGGVRTVASDRRFVVLSATG